MAHLVGIALAFSLLIHIYFTTLPKLVKQQTHTEQKNEELSSKQQWLHIRMCTVYYSVLVLRSDVCLERSSYVLLF